MWGSFFPARGTVQIPTGRAKWRLHYINIWVYMVTTLCAGNGVVNNIKRKVRVTNPNPRWKPEPAIAGSATSYVQTFIGIIAPGTICDRISNIKCGVHVTNVNQG